MTSRAGVGARYFVHWKIGSVPVGGLIEVVEFDDLRDLAWVGITGVNLRGRIRLRDTEKGQTKVTFRLSYQAPGRDLGLHRRPGRGAPGGSHHGGHPQAPQGSLPNAAAD